MTPRSMAMPTRPVNRKADGNGDRHRIVEQPRRQVAHEFLHHERGIGAQHHHLAVRHVDDAHDAEGDGEPDGREQQDGAERQAVPEVLDHLPAGEILVDGRNRIGCRALHGGRQIGGQAAEQSAGILVAAVANDADGLHLVDFFRRTAG